MQNRFLKEHCAVFFQTFKTLSSSVLKKPLLIPLPPGPEPFSMKKVEIVHLNSIEGVQIINSERIKNLQALDQGFFGSVYLGELNEEDLIRRVVVKSAKNDDVSMEEEIKTMQKINDHDFILELIGVCYNLDGTYQSNHMK